MSGRIFSSSLAFIFLLALAALAVVAPHFAGTRQAAFVAAMILMTGEFAAIGWTLRERLAGVIIDARNVMSLSKLQACAWTVLVLSSLLIGAAFNLASGNTTNPLSITLPPELLVAMGISATSLAATPALLSLKQGSNPSPTSLIQAATSLNQAAASPNQPAAKPGAPAAQPATPVTAATVPRVGTMITNNGVADANWTDMLTGDEVGNFDVPDLGKIQQLLVTLLLLGVYGTMVFYKFAGAARVDSLPTLDPSFIWLMGVSHASYLAYKAAPHTDTTVATATAVPTLATLPTAVTVPTA
jgi:hypothetical protein